MMRELERESRMAKADTPARIFREEGKKSDEGIRKRKKAVAPVPMGSINGRGTI